MGRTTAVILIAGAAALAGCGEEKTAAPAIPPSAASLDAGAAAEARYWEAWRALECDHRPAEALPILRSIAGDESAPDVLRGRALLLVARGERLLGRGAEAEKTLRLAQDRHGSHAALRGQVQAELASLAGSRGRYLTGLLVLRAGQFLDLDAGGIFEGPITPGGSRAEAALGGGELLFLSETAPDPDGMAGLMPWLSDAPWTRMTTDRGALAWVQVLRAGEEPVLRFVTRVSGEGPPLGPPADPFCVGRGEAVEVRFTPDPRYASYRIERRVGPQGAFEEVARVETAAFLDGDAEDGVRYGYRITGLTAGGDEGMPAVVQGTTRSRGIVKGTCILRNGSGRNRRPDFDFLRGEFVEEVGDLQLVSFWGNWNGASFLDFSGRRVLTAPGGVGALRTPWTPEDGIRRSDQIPAGGWFLVPLRGGGVARCLLTMQPGTPEGRLDYEVDPDADAFPEGPVVTAEPITGGGARVMVLAAGGLPEEVTAIDLRGDGVARSIPMKDGEGLDSAAVEGTLTRYEAVATDAYGRRSTPGFLVLSRVPGVVRGEFSLHYQQGWSIEQGREVGPGEADLWFESCAGGISQITLAAAGGIGNLGGRLERNRGGPEVPEIYGALVRVDPGSVELRPRAMGDSRIPPTDVFVLRTRGGGWAKIAITDRTEVGGWTEYPATIRFAWNPREPVFEEGRTVEEERGGIGLTWLDPGVVELRELSRRLPGAALDSGPARSLLARLKEERISINAQETTLEEVANLLGGMGIPVELAAGVDPDRGLSLRLRKTNLFEALKVITLSVECDWTISPEGRVVLLPVVKGR